MRYVQFNNLSPIANGVASLMRLSSFAFSNFENLRVRNRAALKSSKQEIASKNRDFRPMRKSNRESIRRARLSKTLSGFHLHCIWSRPRASALRDNLSFSLPSAHAAFFIVSANFFSSREAHNSADAVRVRVGQSGVQEHVATDLIYEENAYCLSLSERS
jgi:hypothetical protein